MNKTYEEGYVAGFNHNIEVVKKLENQQREFIEYLENKINYIKSYYSQINGNYMRMQPVIETLEKTLSKYQEIIGEKNE